MIRAPSFLERVQSYQKEYVTADMIRLLRPLVTQPGFDMDNIKKKSCAATSLCGWVLAYYHWYNNK